MEFEKSQEPKRPLARKNGAAASAPKSAKAEANKSKPTASAKPPAQTEEPAPVAASEQNAAPDAQKAVSAEVPNIRLAPEQIEEIHTDEYSLTLFYATRIQPLSIAEIKRQFPEPEPKKAESVMDRFVRVGLVEITEEGRFYSKYPENYINYSHYRYDGDLEARKDSKVFRLMKEFTGNKEYWKDKTYFSMDAFYTSEQTNELLEMFRQIKLKAKEFANDNAKKKSTKDLTFRRIKFYDMNLALFFAFFLSLGSALMPKIAEAGGNDPHIRYALINDRIGTLNMIARSGGGNDPTAMLSFRSVMSFGAAVPSATPNPFGPPVTTGGGGHDPGGSDSRDAGDGGGGHDPSSVPNLAPKACGGGGHDPVACPSCVMEIEGERVPVYSPSICRLKTLLQFAIRCGASQHPACQSTTRQIDRLIERIERGED